MTQVIDYLTSLSCREIFDQYPLSVVYVFGSQATGTAHLDSDIDLLYETREGARFTLFDMFDLKSKIEKSSGKQVDIVSRAGLRDDIRPYVESEKIKIYQGK